MNGALVKAWMQEKRIRPEELAVKLGVSFSTIRSIMAGKKPYHPTIIVLAGLMGVRESDLMIEPKKSGVSKRATQGSSKANTGS